ncbi:Transmembrane domain-containing protein [Orpheovirus IHUMI-LCC2]|uniref:Transmembrane domain-containing protein n=1 Tax=Orpheovirus IHUMI-LCC2 TaxID=2023057 RepID=A0A2I2L3J3_9VIRU|nr:Transmembrane domain-containing protein [Orpheovirus IHUMI-LCC2]SNW62093.1 Transmembrane domain-containing protein [Orpheovirus IHUMI-LCC2]
MEVVNFVSSMFIGLLLGIFTSILVLMYNNERREYGPKKMMLSFSNIPIYVIGGIFFGILSELLL